MSCSEHAGRLPTIVSRGTPTWAASFRAVVVMTPTLRRMTQSGWATLTRSQVAGPLADKPDLGRVLTPVGARGGEDRRKHPPLRGVRAPEARREQGNLVLRGPLQQGRGERGAEQNKRRRPRRPLGFEALVALDAAGDVQDRFALLPDQ